MYKLICKNFCEYYRENKEDIGHCFPVKVFTFTKQNFISVKKADNISYSLKTFFCKNCEFYPHDCDFHRKGEKGMPCGGYIYYHSLLKTGILNKDELKKLCSACKAYLPEKA